MNIHKCLAEQYKFLLKGRRGLDEKGNVIVYVKDASKLPESIELKMIVDTKGE